MKSSNIYTTTRLFTLAAAKLHNETREVDGEHMSMTFSIRSVKRKYYFPISSLRRANKILDHLYGPLYIGTGFGKKYSESLNEFAVANTLRNRDHRVTALLMAAEFARSPLRVKVKRVDTSPVKITQPKLAIVSKTTPGLFGNPVPCNQIK